MMKRKTPYPDIDEIGTSIFTELKEENRPESLIVTKNPHAVALGRLGGKKGGKARAEKLTADQRIAIAKKAAQVRWKSHSKGNNDQLK